MDTGMIPSITLSSLPASDPDLSSPSDQAAVVRVRDLFKIYRERGVETVALRGVDLQLLPGEMVAVIGPSGSGKSTLLSLIGGMDTPSAGQVWLAGRELSQLPEIGRAELRRRTVGFLFQEQNLIPFLSALENVMLPLQLAHDPQPTGRAMDLLTQVGLADRLHHRLDALSGGEQQRAGLACALANRPQLLLADEPTGELDSVTAHSVMNLLTHLSRREGVAVLLVTHDPDMAAYADRVVTMRDGAILNPTTRRG